MPKGGAKRRRRACGAPSAARPDARLPLLLQRGAVNAARAAGSCTSDEAEGACALMSSTSSESKSRAASRAPPGAPGYWGAGELRQIDSKRCGREDEEKPVTFGGVHRSRRGPRAR